MDGFETCIGDRIDRADCWIRCLVIRKKEDSVKRKMKQLEKVENQENVFKPRKNRISVREGQSSFIQQMAVPYPARERLQIF